MMRYEAYKHSGVDWIGDIPEGWEVVRFKRLFKEKRKTTDTSLNSGSISFGEVVYKDDEKITEATKLSYQVLNEGEFLLNPLNMNYDLKSLRIGLSTINVVVSSGYIILQSKKGLNKNYYRWLLRMYDIVFMKTLGAGVRQTINYNDLADSRLIVPSFDEQQTIAQFLDDKTAKIDQTIGIRQKEIGLLKERRQILIQQAVTGKWSMVNGQWLKTQTEKLKPSGVDWIGEIPEHWEVTPMRRLIDVRDGTHDTPFYIENSSFSHYLITSKDFEGDDINYTQAKSISRKDYEEIRKRSGVETGDVIMSMIGGNIGKSVIISTKTDIAIKNVGLFKTKGNITMSKYIRYYLQSGLLKIQAEINSKGGAQSFLSLGDLRNLRFFKMPFEDMVQIVNFIEVNISKIAKAISIKEQEIEKLKEYKTVLIDNVVTGKVRVS